MLRRVLLSVALLGTVSANAGAPPQASGQDKLRPDDFLAVCGDSITEQKLYCRFIEEYLLMCRPSATQRVMQLGWNGETSWGFLSKMPDEALRFDASAVTICFGMNDGGYLYNETNYPRYRKALTDVVRSFKQDGVRFIVLASPGVVDTETFWAGKDKAVKYNPVLGKLKDVAREVAAAEGVVFANIHDPMQAVMEKAKAKFGKAYALAGEEDGVHPDENGHLVMAYVMLKALGFDGEIGTITLDAAANTATASEGHQLLGVANGAVEVLSTRYPFCFYGDAKSPKSPKGILEFVPFNEELNRFKLVVKNAPSARVRVTWGSATKEFAAADLAKGINLAAEFLDNPFSQPFLKVEEAVKAQQNYETPLVKRLMHELADLEKLVPEEKATMEQIKAAGMRKARALFERAKAEVRPVRHVIRIEAVK
jgi:lysophospholipase L1-like esterase